MPDQITVPEFIAETTEDYNSPTTSSFTTRLQNCRNTVTLLEEALDQDRTALQKVKKSVKAIYNSGQGTFHWNSKDGDQKRPVTVGDGTLDQDYCHMK